MSCSYLSRRATHHTRTAFLGPRLVGTESCSSFSRSAGEGLGLLSSCTHQLAPARTTHVSGGGTPVEAARR